MIVPNFSGKISRKWRRSWSFRKRMIFFIKESRAFCMDLIAGGLVSLSLYWGMGGSSWFIFFFMIDPNSINSLNFFLILHHIMQYSHSLLLFSILNLNIWILRSLLYFLRNSGVKLYLSYIFSKYSIVMGSNWVALN